MSHSHCPSCGRYVGPYEQCPYCSARLTGRISVRTVKIVAILLASVGLAALWFAATHAEVPLIQIGQAGATTNMAYVRLEGLCTRAPTYDPAGDYLSFWIEDGTGEMRVSAYRAETQRLIEQGRVPAPGDRVEVAGTLRVREDFLSLTLNVPEELRIARAEPVERDIGAIAPRDQYTRVRVRGEVRQIYAPYDGLTLITLRDNTGSIPVAVSRDLIALSGASPTLTVGQPAEVVAAVSLYGDRPQLVPATVGDIRPLDRAPSIAIERPIGHLTAGEIGQQVVVSGTVTRVDPFSSGVKYTVDDGSGSVVLLLWQSVHEALPDPAALGVGARLRAQGELSRYRGQLEIVPELAEDIQVLAAAAPSAQTTIGELTTIDVGRVVTLRGVLGQPEAFSSGIKFPLDGGSGTITLLLWQNVYDAIPAAERPAAGTRVEVTGRIEEYRGELEIVPQADGIRNME